MRYLLVVSISYVKLSSVIYLSFFSARVKTANRSRLVSRLTTRSRSNVTESGMRPRHRRLQLKISPRVQEMVQRREHWRLDQWTLAASSAVSRYVRAGRLGICIDRVRNLPVTVTADCQISQWIRRDLRLKQSYTVVHRGCCCCCCCTAAVTRCNFVRLRRWSSAAARIHLQWSSQQLCSTVQLQQDCIRPEFGDFIPPARNGWPLQWWQWSPTENTCWEVDYVWVWLMYINLWNNLPAHQESGFHFLSSNAQSNSSPLSSPTSYPRPLFLQFMFCIVLYALFTVRA